MDEYFCRSENLHDEFSFKSIKYKQESTMILTYTNPKISLIVSMLNILLLQNKIKNLEYTKLLRPEGYKYIISLLTLNFQKLHGAKCYFSDGSKLYSNQFSDGIYNACLKSLAANCSFRTPNAVDACDIKRYLESSNIPIYHAWIPEKKHIIFEFRNYKEICAFLNERPGFSGGDPEADSYAVDFIRGKLLTKITQAGLKGLHDAYKSSEPAILYHDQTYDVIFRHKDVLLILEANRSNKLIMESMFKTVSMEENQRYLDSEYNIIEGTEPVDSQVDSSKYILYPYEITTDQKMLEKKKEIDAMAQKDLDDPRNSIVCKILNKYHKKSQVNIGQNAKASNEIDYFPFITKPQPESSAQTFQESINELKNKDAPIEKKEDELLFVKKDTDNLNEFKEYLPFRTREYSLPPYIWQLSTGNPNPNYNYNYFVHNPYYWTHNANQAAYIVPMEAKKLQNQHQQQLPITQTINNLQHIPYQKPLTIQEQTRKFLKYEPKATPIKIKSKSNINDSNNFALCTRPEVVKNVEELTDIWKSKIQPLIELSGIPINTRLQENEIGAKAIKVPDYIQYQLMSDPTNTLLTDPNMNLSEILDIKNNKEWRRKAGNPTFEDFSARNPWIIELYNNNNKYLSMK